MIMEKGCSMTFLKTLKKLAQKTKVEVRVAVERVKILTLFNIMKGQWMDSISLVIPA